MRKAVTKPIRVVDTPTIYGGRETANYLDYAHTVAVSINRPNGLGECKL
jgi:hypothetical protein